MTENKLQTLQDQTDQIKAILGNNAPVGWHEVDWNRVKEEVFVISFTTSRYYGVTKLYPSDLGLPDTDRMRKLFSLGNRNIVPKSWIRKSNAAYQRLIRSGQRYLFPLLDKQAINIVHYEDFYNEWEEAKKAFLACADQFANNIDDYKRKMRAEYMAHGITIWQNIDAVKTVAQCQRIVELLSSESEVLTRKWQEELQGLEESINNGTVDENLVLVELDHEHLTLKSSVIDTSELAKDEGGLKLLAKMEQSFKIQEIIKIHFYDNESEQIFQFAENFAEAGLKYFPSAEEVQQSFSAKISVNWLPLPSDIAADQLIADQIRRQSDLEDEVALTEIAKEDAKRRVEQEKVRAAETVADTKIRMQERIHRDIVETERRNLQTIFDQLTQGIEAALVNEAVESLSYIEKVLNGELIGKKGKPIKAGSAHKAQLAVILERMKVINTTTNSVDIKAIIQSLEPFATKNNPASESNYQTQLTNCVTLLQAMSFNFESIRERQEDPVSNESDYDLAFKARKRVYKDAGLIEEAHENAPTRQRQR